MLVSPRGYHRWWRALLGPIFFPRRGSSHGHISVLLTSCIAFFAVVDYLIFTASSISSPRESTDTTVVPGIRSVYVASTHWNNEAILRSHWNAAVVELARKFGKDNIYVSVYESGSWDDSKGALRELDQQLEELGVDRTIILDPATHEDEINKPPGREGWIDTPRGKRELRRIPYLAHMRNRSLEPLERLVQAGRTFDKIIFLNDVIFSMTDIITLLNTRSGSYAAACSLDFGKPGLFYDTFALRDSKGSPAFSQRYPYFSARRSRNALIAGKPIPVQSCWNGIAIFDAAPFQTSTNPLRFRGIPDSLAKYHLEGSECCLIHYDNPLSATKGVWLNPNVRVGYNLVAYEAAAARVWPSTLDAVLVGWWKGFFASMLDLPWRSRAVVRRVKKWAREGESFNNEKERKGNREVGLPCLIDEMQIIVYNGWAHV
ncbi:polysaccharide export protein, variant [Blastomyces gilchristii SLH14081]|uniref:Polysaccharide export protein n=1 Tax=Blastomyces gilchristii (strain SLH14081) TaxID=559298 RepID=A0A179UMU6_BLAGS|nr:polysaccharide export protein [Blastomyces gilchristii SLH14081]XP_031578749.1 polysaccharide export protein, variant [Blastomyces gilchristii SLH14081]OAT09294.1 polysaccharide export protein [Blastomyces gilchristii SLH14081]OAT09295.1 polysaccharide export protein, variant [Blastomyces gilchristii SLH14081]